MAKIYLPIGIPGSGKSTLAKKSFSDCTVLESDAIREELYGSAERQTNPGRVFALMRKRTLQALADGKDVVYDATNISRWARGEILKAVPEGTEKIAVFLDIPYSVCVERNAKRERKVPEEAIAKMFRNLEPPEESEGWNKVIYIVHNGEERKQ